ncbi:unnamed protein product [Heterobilharzia americana]|nr:unnamed protein product [Heterobilharzia americana]
MSSRLGVVSDTTGLMDYEDRLCKAAEQYKALLIEKEQLIEQCNCLKNEVFTLQEENSSLQLELNKLKLHFNSLGLNQLLTTETTITTTTVQPESSSSSSTVEPISTTLNSIDTELMNKTISTSNNVIMSPTIANVRIGHLQNQLSKLRDELYRTECDKEELKIKLTEMTTRNQELKQKCSILATKAEESVHLKDELDIAREEASAAVRLSATIEQLRKYADEAVNLRVRCSQLETDNQICIQRLAELEQETRLGGKIRSQVKAQRLQAEDAQLEANEAIRRAELAENELNKVRQELIASNREKECIFSELTRLRSCCEGLQLCAQSNYERPLSNTNTCQMDPSLMLSPAMQSQMLNLQEELSRLRTSFYSTEGSGGNVGHDSSGVTVSVYDEDDYNDDKSVYESNLLIGQSPSDMLVTSTSHDYLLHCKTTDCALSITSDVIQSTDHSNHHQQHDDLQESYNSLLTRLTQKENDFIEMEQKYRGYLWKAREVIRLLERQHRIHQDICPQYRMNCSTKQINTGDKNDDDDDGEEINHLRALLVEKERVIEKLETHHEQMRRHRETEERIVLSAWYNLITQSTQNTIEESLRRQSCKNCNYPSTKLNSTLCCNTDNNNNNNNVSFLTRQRNLHLKPPRDLTSVVMASK